MPTVLAMLTGLAALAMAFVMPSLKMRALRPSRWCWASSCGAAVEAQMPGITPTHSAPLRHRAEPGALAQHVRLCLADPAIARPWCCWQWLTRTTLPTPSAPDTTHGAACSTHRATAPGAVPTAVHGALSARRMDSGADPVPRPNRPSPPKSTAPQNGPATCPHCGMESPPPPSGAMPDVSCRPR